MLTKHYNPISAQDYIPRPLLRQIQLQRLQKIVQHEYRNVEVYRRRMDEKGVKPSDIRSLEDIAKLPFMMKKDLRDTYPFGLFALDMKQVVRLHASSGTTGKPIVVGYTKEDIDVWVSCMMRALAMGGVDRGDIIQNSYGYGLFTGGLGAHYGVEALGATVVPTSGGNTERQVMLMRDFGVLPSAQDAFLLDLGLQTLPVRMAQHCKNAQRVAEYLKGLDKVEFVNYPGLPGDSQHEKAKKYLPGGCSGVIAFSIRGPRENASSWQPSSPMWPMRAPAYCIPPAILTASSPTSSCAPAASRPA